MGLTIVGAAYPFSIEGPIEPYTYSEVRRHLKAALEDARPISFEMDSAGGDPTSALAIYAALRAYPHPVHCEVRRAASGGAVIALGADRRTITEDGHFMLHPARSAMVGTGLELLEAGERLLGIDRRVAEIVAEATGMTVEFCADLASTERWIGAAEALDLGLAHEVASLIFLPPPPHGHAMTLHERADLLDRLAVKFARPGERARRHADAIGREAKRLRDLTREMRYTALGVVWGCVSCGAVNSHGLDEAAACLACGSTG